MMQLPDVYRSQVSGHKVTPVIDNASNRVYTSLDGQYHSPLLHTVRRNALDFADVQTCRHSCAACRCWCSLCCQSDTEVWLCKRGCADAHRMTAG